MTAYSVIRQAEIPVNRNRHPGRRPLYPWAALGVGDGFDVPRNGRTPSGGDRVQATVANAGRKWAERHNPAARFTVRILDEHTVHCVRVS